MQNATEDEASRKKRGTKVQNNIQRTKKGTCFSLFSNKYNKDHVYITNTKKRKKEIFVWFHEILICINFLLSKNSTETKKVLAQPEP